MPGYAFWQSFACGTIVPESYILFDNDREEQEAAVVNFIRHNLPGRLVFYLWIKSFPVCNTLLMDMLYK